MKVPKPPIIWKGSHPNNFTVGRPAGQPTEMTEHWIVGSLQSAFNTFQNGARGASSTYGIGGQGNTRTPWGTLCGLIWQFVDEANTSWADGNWGSNQRSVTTEHEGGPSIPLTNELYEASAWLLAWRMQNKTVGYIKGHRDVSTAPTQCPGTLDINRIKRRAQEIITICANMGTVQQPTWLKNRVAENLTVYSHKDGLFLRDLNDPTKAVDSRRWGLNQIFEIGGSTTVGGKKYYITKSSVSTNAAAGLLEGEVKTTKYVAPKPVPTIIETKTFKPVKEFEFNKDTSLVTIPAGTKVTEDKVSFAKGEKIDIQELLTYSDGSRFYRTEYSASKKIFNGFRLEDLNEVAIKPDPVPTVPVWVGQIQEEPKRKMYVLRATPLIDLENGHPYIDPKTNKEVWFQAGSIIEDLVAHVVIEDRTYRLTEYAYSKTKAGEWKLFANGIDSNDLSTDPESTPEGTPANPSTEERLTLIEQFIAALKKWLKEKFNITL